MYVAFLLDCFSGSFSSFSTTQHMSLDWLAQLYEMWRSTGTDTHTHTYSNCVTSPIKCAIIFNSPKSIWPIRWICDAWRLNAVQIITMPNHMTPPAASWRDEQLGFPAFDQCKNVRVYMSPGLIYLFNRQRCCCRWGQSNRDWGQ